MWGEDGSIAIEMSYVEGVIHGRFLNVGPNGAILNDAIYRNGEPWEGVVLNFGGRVLYRKGVEVDSEYGTGWKSVGREWSKLHESSKSDDQL